MLKVFSDYVYIYIYIYIATLFLTSIYLRNNNYICIHFILLIDKNSNLKATKTTT